MAKDKNKSKGKKEKKKGNGGNSLESHINKGLTKHAAQNEMLGAGSVKK